jgi:hypothetical protein
VIEMALWVAGPATGGILADWGADVVKIEPPDGDRMRALFAPVLTSREAPIGEDARDGRHAPGRAALTQRRGERPCVIAAACCERRGRSLRRSSR